jgi:uncharacterized protein YfaS (alpha-2-macroglobulin family)
VIAGLLIAPAGPLLSRAQAQMEPAVGGEMPAVVPAMPVMEETPVNQAAQTPQTTNGLTLLLGAGAEGEGAPVAGPPVAAGEPLSAEETAALLGRAAPIEPTQTLTEEFRLPPASLPPPVAGTTITQTFPPPESPLAPPVETGGPLAVLRYAPQGEIPLAPFLNVTFNQPMVPLATLDELSSADVPVQLTPELQGVWKWLGTTTLSFEARDDERNRFPMATVFTATIPAGTTSAVGGTLAETVSWTFSTPPPTVVMSYPQFGPQSHEPLLFVAFDQRIDPAAVLATITASAGGQTFGLRPATQEEVASDATVSGYVEHAGEGRWLAFKPARPFPGETTVTVNIGPGTPSAEGPLVTQQVQSFSFQTYGALRITNSYCGWGGGECPPGQSFTVEFNNPLDATRINNSLVTADPAIPGMTVSASYNQLTIRGATAGRTQYKVTIDGAVQDIFGQTLGEDKTLTFQTGNASSYLTGPEGPLVTLDPTAATPVFTVYSINYDKLRVRAYAVTPEQWPAYLTHLQDFYRDRGKEPPGEKVLEETIEVQVQPDTLTETAIDLSAALGGKPGHLIVVVDKPASLLSLFMPSDDYVVQSWVQATNLGLDAISDNQRMTAWATRLADGQPLSGVQLQLLPGTVQATTGEDGLARIALPSTPATVLVGRLGEDVAILPRANYIWDTSGWAASPATEELRWFVFDDRAMYRPGEEVHVKGFVRQIEFGPEGDVSMGGLAGSPVSYQVMDPQGNLLDEGRVELSSLGGFSLAFTLPLESNLGYASIQFAAQNAGSAYNTSYYHGFQVQEFRRPEFAVTAANATTGPYYLGDTATLEASAQYYAGGPLPGAATDWTISATPTDYRPPNWDEFAFGVWTPWWSMNDYARGGMDMVYSDVGYFPGPGMEGPLLYNAATDATGSHYLDMTFIASKEPRPYSVLAEARVMDVNNQAWAATTSLLVHPSALYVGLRSAGTFVEQGDPLDIELIVTDVDGKAVGGRPVQVQAVRLAWEFAEGAWQQTETDEQICDVTSENAPVTCTFATATGGEYRLRAEVRDDNERLNRTELTRWVSGGQTIPQRSVTMETAVLVPDKEEYQPGDTARVLVQSPFTQATGLLTIARDGIVSNEPFTLDGSTATLEIPIAASYLPNVHIQVDLVGSAPRLDDKGNPLADAPARPAYASGGLDLSVPPLSRTLDVTATVAADKVDPGAETSLDLLVTGPDGKPVADAELAVVVVDEAVLALSGYQLADPLATFYTARGAGTSTTYGRATIVLANPQVLAEQMQNAVARDAMGGAMADMAVAESAAMPAPAAGAPMATAPAMAQAMAPALAADEESQSKGETAGPPIAVRSDFNPLALFAPDVRTDAAGRAAITYKLPDNLTRYRVMVVAATEQQFGSAEANLTARLPLMVRPSAPRFLNFGDRFEFPVVLQNQTDAPLTVDVAIGTANLRLDGTGGRRVTVPANDRVAVRFGATTDNVGTAYAQIVAASGAYGDASQVQLPVYTPATTEAFAVYGTVDEGAVRQPISSPQDVFPQFGGLEVATSATALQSLTDAVLYLQNYPFECSEQIASRVMSVAALRDVLTAFAAGGLQPPAEIEAAVARDIELLEQLQNDDGGWPFWTRGDESIVYNSIFVTHALVMARAKDYRVQQATLDAARSYLLNVEAYYAPWYSPAVRQTLSAYALYVRSLLGDFDPAKAREVYAQLPLDEASLEALAWLWQVMAQDAGSAEQVAAIARRINNSAVETAGMANFFSSYGDQEWVMLHSDRRTDAVVLDALIALEPDSDLIVKVVRGLMAARENGRWGNTQENVWVILAMDRYFNTFENVAPDFIARVWLGDTYVAESEFRGYTTDTYETTVPMRYLTEQAGTQDLVIAKEGDGRLYYRLGLTYAPTDLTLAPLDMGFVVQRTYEAVDDPADVTRDSDGVWRIEEGARVRIKLTLVAVNRRYHVALVDRLPAGLEIINPDLAVSESVPQNADPAAYGGSWWWGTWYDHQNLRDAGAEAFATYLWDGVYTYTYVARATTPGTYVVPPARAEEMYSPEVFGRTGSETVIVE